MEDFPKLLLGQAAILRAELNTGIVLDEDLKYATTNEQIVFKVFNSIDEAKGYAVALVKSNPDIELNVYKDSEQFVFRIDRDNVDTFDLFA